MDDLFPLFSNVQPQATQSLTNIGEQVTFKDSVKN